MIRVSILVLMEVILQEFLRRYSSRHIRVSILVLMEVILQASLQRSSVAREKCFNPCFNGSYSSGALFCFIIIFSTITSLLLTPILQLILSENNPAHTFFTPLTLIQTLKSFYFQSVMKLSIKTLINSPD